MSEYQPVVVSRRIDAPAELLWGLITDPANHTPIDGSGMLQGLSDGTTMSGVGDVFRMKMHNDRFGHYEMANNVIDFEPGRSVVWEPVLWAVAGDTTAEGVGQSAEYRWGWSVEPQDDGSTLVTETYDCSRSPEWLREAVQDGEGWRSAMEASLERLATLAVGGEQTDAV